MILAKVDFPAPFSPSSAWISPRTRSRSTSRSTSMPANSLLMPRAAISGRLASIGTVSDMLLDPSAWYWRIGDEQVLRLEVGPESGRDRCLNGGHVLRHLGGAS